MNRRCPLVSVVVPTFNRGSLLTGLLASLDQLEFKDDEFEVIIVDDGSTDDTARVVNLWAQDHPERRLVRETRRGGYAARNAGIRAASGEIVAFTDDDCRVAPDWLTHIADAFTNNPHILGVQGRTETLPGLVTPFTHQIVVERPTGLFETCNIAYRRRTLLEVGGFAEVSQVGFGDTQLGVAVTRRGSICFEPRALVLHPPRPRVFRDRSRWRDMLRGEMEYYRQERAHYRVHRGPTFVTGVVWRWVLGSTVKQLFRHRRWLTKEPRTYLRFVACLARERLCLVAALGDVLLLGRVRD